MNIIDCITVNVKDYPFQSWDKKFPDKKIKIRSLCFNSEWDPFFDKIDYYEQIEQELEKYLRKGEIILPYPDLLFNSLNILFRNMLKVVFLGQDPYFNINEEGIPQACGLSFSVPYGYPAPPSLHNIYQNLVKYGHMKTKPRDGCIMGWVVQGCLMINSAWTTLHKQPNAHKSIWPRFTKDFLMYINDNCENLVFLSWGSNAHELSANIDSKKHLIIRSSHPSPQSFMTEGRYPAFMSVDQGGLTNKYLKSHGKDPIIWDVIDL